MAAAFVPTLADSQLASFRRAGFVSLEPGLNTVRAIAVADQGAKAERQVHLSLVDEPAKEAELPVDLVVQRNRLLEDCLLIAKQQRLAREQERNEEIRKALLLEIERERRKARERADQQRKQLELEGEDTETETTP